MKGYVEFKESGIKVDLRRFFKSKEGKEELRKIDEWDKRMFPKIKSHWRWSWDRECWLVGYYLYDYHRWVWFIPE